MIIIILKFDINNNTNSLLGKREDCLCEPVVNGILWSGRGELEVLTIFHNIVEYDFEDSVIYFIKDYLWDE